MPIEVKNVILFIYRSSAPQANNFQLAEKRPVIQFFKYNVFFCLILDFTHLQNVFYECFHAQIIYDTKKVINKEMFHYVIENVIIHLTKRIIYHTIKVVIVI